MPRRTSKSIFRTLSGRASPSGIACFLLAVGVLSSSARAALDITMSPQGGTNVVDTGDSKCINLTYTWSSLTSNLSNGKIVIDVAAPLDGSSSKVSIFNSAHIASSSYNSSTRQITYNFINPLPAGSSGTLSFCVEFPNGSTIDGATALVNATSSGTGQPNGTASVTLEANASAKATLDKSAPRNPAVNENLTYTVTFSNGYGDGTYNVINPVVVDQLPPGAAYVSSSDGGVYNAGANTVTWTLSTLNPGYAYYLKVTVRFPSGTFSVGQSVTNTVTLTATGPDGAPINRNASDTRQIAAPSPSGLVGKVDYPDPASHKGWLEYAFVVENAGNVTLTNYTLVDDFPPEFIPTHIKPGQDAYGGNTTFVQVDYKTNLNGSWRVLPGSPFTIMPGFDPVVQLDTIGLAASEVVTSVRLTYPSLPPEYNSGGWTRVDGFAGHWSTGLDRNGAAITGLPKTINNTANITYTYGGTNYTASDTEPTLLMVPSPIPKLLIHDADPEDVQPLEEMTWEIETLNLYGGSAPLINPVYATLLPPELEYVPGSMVKIQGVLNMPAVTVTDNYNGTGRQLVKWAFAGNHPVEWETVGTSSERWYQTMEFRTKVKAGTPPGDYEIEFHLIGHGNSVLNPYGRETERPDTFDLDGDGDTTETFFTSNRGDFTIVQLLAVESVMWVKGQLDAAFNKYPDAGAALPNGPVEMKLVVTNPGNVSLTGIRVMDILPHVGDAGVVLHNLSRGSDFGLTMTSAVTAPAGVTVKYSTSSNPVRSDLDASLSSPAGAVSGSFSMTAPSPLSNTKSLLFDFGALVLAPGESKEITWTMNMPAVANVGQVAWNSFGHRSQSAADGTPVPPAEPIKVGIANPVSVGSFVWQDANNNGQQDSGEPGISGAQIAVIRSDGSPALDPLGAAVPATTTDASGIYRIGALANGDYFVRVTPPGGFVPSAVQTADPDDDDDLDSNIDTSRSPPAGSYESGVFTFAVETEPVGETGAGGAQDDVDDDNGNMTIDFGFFMVPDDFGDHSGFANASSSVSAAIKLGAAVTDSEATPTKNATATGDDTTGTDDEDGVTFGSLVQGQSGSVTVNRTNTSGSSAYLNAWIDFNNNGSLADAGEQIINNVAISDGTSGGQAYTFAIPAAAVAGNLGARFRITSTSAPGPAGSSGSGEVEDHIAAMQPALSLGDLVWNDTDNDGVKDAGESGLAGATVQLFRPGGDSTVNTGDDVQVGVNQLTPASGAYLFTSLAPGTYFVKVTPPAGYMTGGTPAVTDNNVDNNNDGAQPGGVSAPLFSPIVTLSVAGESTTDGDADSNTNLTVDFGLWPGITVGDLVFNDVNDNGVKDATENGIGGVTVELLNGAGTSVLATTTTNALGGYGFTVYTAGTYKLRAYPTAIYPLASSAFTNSDNGVNNDNNGSQPGPKQTASTSPAITLTAGGEPGASGSTNIENTIDFGLRGCPTLVPDPCVVPDAICGVPYTPIQFTVTGGVAPYTWTASSLPVGLTLTSGGYLSGTPWTYGTISFTVTVTDAKGCAINKTIGINIFCPVITVSHAPDPLPMIVERRNLTLDFSASGGVAPHTYSVAAGALPAGLSLNPATGRLSGKPTVHGNFNVTIRATDLYGCSGDKVLSMEVLPPLGVGNMVFRDDNGNGRLDGGEGVDGVTLELYSGTQVPGVHAPLDTQVSSGGGRYLFEGLLPGFYRVHVPAANFASGAPLQSTISIAEGLTGDDDVGEDGTNSPQPEVSGISSGVVSISLGAAPTDLNGETGVDHASDNEYDAAVDLTVDFGFANPLGVGNMIFRDQNSNGRHDTGEGVGSVAVELYRASDTPGLALPVATTVTDSAGHYLFDYLMAGSYYVFIPASEFASGGHLQGLMSVTGAGTAVADDNVDENGLDVLSPQATGVRSVAFSLANNSEPTNAAGETGYLASEDSRDDNNYDLTIDLGFAAPDHTKVGLGNLVFLDANGNSVFDSGEGVAGVIVKLFAEGVNPITGTAISATATSAGGFYSFGGLAPGRYFVHIPAGEFGAGRTLAGKLSVPGAGGDFGDDDNLDENGIDVADPAVSGVSSGVVQLTVGGEPTDLGSEVGAGFYLDVLDSNSDLTVDFGFIEPVGIGNLVYRDVNRNGRADAGEGTGGVRVELFGDGYYPGFDDPVAATITSSLGRYRFEGLAPGAYYVHVPPSEFAVGKPLYGALSVSGVQTGDDNTGEDGIDEPVPAVFGVSTGVVTLTAGGAPVGTAEAGQGGAEDNAKDSSVDMTIDLGFVIPVPKTVSGRVRYDLDGDGDLAEPGDLMLAGVDVTLYRDLNDNLEADEGDEVLGTVITSSSGTFSFQVLLEGAYLLVETDPAGAASTGDSGGANDNVILLDVTTGDIAGNDFLDVIEPQGYIYSPVTGALVTGGVVSVSGPGEIRTLLNGSAGIYAWTRNEEAAGPFTVSYTPPSGKELDPTRPSQLVALDPTGQASPYALGSGLNPARTHLASHTEGANPWYAVMNLSPGDPLVTRNNIPVVDMSTRTWAGWQYLNPLGGQNGPSQNPDGDAQDNLQEFAFGLDPASGLARGKRPLEVTRNAATGAIEARVRRVIGLSGAVLRLEGIADLAASPGGWFQITSLTPVVTSNGDGSESLLYSDLATVPGLGTGRGFVRVKVDLDADGNGTPEATSRTGASGWSTRVFERALQTFAPPFINPAEFGGTVTAVSPGSIGFSSSSVGAGNSLATAMTAGKQYFLEIVSGAHAGHRLDVDEASTGATTLALDVTSTVNTLATGSLPSTLIGARAELREHATLGGAFDRTRFNSTTTPSTADRLLFFNRASNTYTTYWLFRNGGNPKWVRNGDATLADAGPRVLAPGEGLLAHSKFAVLSTVYAGDVRSWAFACPLGAGTQMIANPWPVTASPAARVMATASGFRGTAIAATADQVRIWLGDTVAGQQGYTTYYYFKSGSYDQWTRQGDGTLANQSSAVIFQPQAAAFVRSVLGNSVWVIPSPWTP